MTVYAITDTKKGRTGIAPTYLHTTPNTARIATCLLPGLCSNYQTDSVRVIVRLGFLRVLRVGVTPSVQSLIDGVGKHYIGPVGPFGRPTRQGPCRPFFEIIIARLVGRLGSGTRLVADGADVVFNRGCSVPVCRRIEAATQQAAAAVLCRGLYTTVAGPIQVISSGRDGLTARQPAHPGIIFEASSEADRSPASPAGLVGCLAVRCLWLFSERRRRRERRRIMHL